MAIDQLLHFAVKHGISDVHLRVGRPAYFRRDGQLVTRKGSVDVTAEQMASWFAAMASERHQADFVRLSEVDFGYDLGEHGRFRVNAGLALREAARAIRRAGAESPRGRGVADIFF